jgi:hypothetical protein
MSWMMSMQIAAAGMLALLLPSPSTAVPLGGSTRSAVADQVRIVEPIHEKPMHSGYTRVCNYGPRGWMLRNHRGQLIVCQPHRSTDFGWTWREEGGRSGWYHSRDRIWR